ncbi:MAG: S9 family peptidase, partial [Actinobacteria bacterium]|nr:S9 family peptidase [Actinomycetota bacterium]
MTAPLVPAAPVTPVRDVVEVLHGTEVHDPYRWLEDGESEETAAWSAAQNMRTRQVLDALPWRRPLHKRLLSLLQVGTISSDAAFAGLAPAALGPAVAGDRIFSLEREGDQDQAVLVARSAIDAGTPAKVVVDPHAMAADRAASIDWFTPSPDGRLVAYGVSEGGSGIGTLRVVDVDTGTLLADAIPHIRHGGLAWLPDGSAFAYTRMPDPATVTAGEEHFWLTVWWHRLGDPPANDELLLGDLARTAWPASSISSDGRWLVFHVGHVPLRTDVILLDRDSGLRTVVVADQDARTWCQVVGDRLYAVTNLGAPRGRVVTAELAHPQPEHWTTIVPESSAVIREVVVAGGRLTVASAEHAVSRLHHYDLDGGDGREIPLPELGSVGDLRADRATGRVFFTFASFVRPPG